MLKAIMNYLFTDWTKKLEPKSPSSQKEIPNNGRKPAPAKENSFGEHLEALNLKRQRRKK